MVMKVLERKKSRERGQGIPGAGQKVGKQFRDEHRRNITSEQKPEEGKAISGADIYKKKIIGQETANAKAVWKIAGEQGH